MVTALCASARSRRRDILSDDLFNGADRFRDPLSQIDGAVAPLLHQCQRMRGENDDARSGDKLLHASLRLGEELRVAGGEPLVKDQYFGADAGRYRKAKADYHAARIG